MYYVQGLVRLLPISAFKPDRKKACLAPKPHNLFKEVTGKSYTEFIASIRMERAKEMLALTDLSINDISRAVGYEDQNYFSRYFRKIEGCSPLEYRKNEKC